MRNLFELCVYAGENAIPMPIPDRDRINYYVSAQKLHNALKPNWSFRKWMRKTCREIDIDYAEDCIPVGAEKEEEYLVPILLASDYCLADKTEHGENLSAFYQEFRQSANADAIKRLEKRIARIEAKVEKLYGGNAQ